MKFSQYNVLFKIDEDGYIINTKNGKYVKFSKQEDKDHYNSLIDNEDKLSLEDDMVKALYNRKFIVDDDIDEYKEVKEELAKIYKAQDDCLDMFFYVTDNCNFRCKYCPQEHLPNKISDELWDGIYKYIENGLETEKFHYIRLSFFGGEPLLESKKIIAFLKKIKILEERFPVCRGLYSITTNGYLLTPKLYDELVSLGVLSYQITVDGFAETHDKIRPLADGSGNWETVMENVKYIASKKDEAGVIFRTNVNNTMEEERMKEWFDWCMKNLPKEKFYISTSSVVPFSDLTDKDLVLDRTKEEKREMMYNLFKQTEEQNFDHLSDILRLNSGACESAKKYYYSVATDGRVSKCQAQHIKEGIWVGKITPEGKMVFDCDIKDWEEFEYEACKTCTAYPICAGRTCPYKKNVYAQYGRRYDCELYSEGFIDLLKGAVKEGIGKKCS